MRQPSKEIKNFGTGLVTVGGNEGSHCKYPTRFDTYGMGCGHNCKYCYARSLLDFRGLRHPNNPKFIDLKTAYKVITGIPEGQITRLGGMTDCFQPVEAIHGITYNTLKVFNYYKKPYLIVTKSSLIGTEKYLNVLDKDLAHIQVTITCTDDEKALTYENASKVSERIATIEKLWSLGYDVQIRLSPYIIQYVDAEKINNIKCDKIVVEFLRVNHWIKKRFDIDYSEYTLTEGGYQHLPLDKKIEYLSRIKKPQITVCEDVDEHYKYWKENVNYNVDDCCNLRK